MQAAADPTHAPTSTPLYRRIVVPLDGSGLSEAALPHAEALARLSGAELILLRAYTLPIEAAPTPGMLIAMNRSALEPATTSRGNLRHAVDRYLEGTAERLRADGISVDVAPLQGPPGEAIVGETMAQEADLVVMGTHARGVVGRMLAGSVADYVLHHAPCPVFLVHPTHE